MATDLPTYSRETPLSKHTPRFQITKLRVKNFRSIRDIELHLSPLTVLVGPNASGKSNLMDVLRFLSDAIRRDLSRALSSRHGIGEVRRWQPSYGPRLSMEIGIEVVHGDRCMEYDFIVASNADGRHWVNEKISVFSKRNGRQCYQEIAIENGNVVTPEWMVSDNGDLDDDTDFDPTDLALPGVSRMHLGLGRKAGDAAGAREIRSDLRLLHRNLQRMHFYQLSPNSLRTLRQQSTPYPLRHDGRNFASVLRDWQENMPDHMDRIRKYLGILVSDVTDMRVESVDGYLVTKLKHAKTPYEGANPWFNLNKESDGTVRLLGLLIALYQRPYPPLIGIEEPELFVHPGVLETLAELLKEASRRSQILVTTHNPDLIDQFRTDNLRVVKSIDGVTEVGKVSRNQAEAVRRHLFSPGELHSMEGLEPDLRH